MTDTTTQQEREALLPCPFCGGDDICIDGDDEFPYVSCRHCMASTGPMPTDAVHAAWNTRATLPQRDEPVAEGKAVEAARWPTVDELIEKLESGECFTPNSDIAEPVAWESTTECFTKYVSDRRYQLFSPKVRAWYKPYRCSNCTTPPSPIGWMTWGTIDGKRKLDAPDFATNPAYIKAHSQWKWEEVYTAATLRQAVKRANYELLMRLHEENKNKHNYFHCAAVKLMEESQ